MTPHTGDASLENESALGEPFRLPEDSPAARNKPLLLAALSQRSVRTATVTYVGSGDSGGIEDVIYDTAEGTAFDGSEIAKVFTRHGHFEDGEWRYGLAEHAVSIDQALRDFAEEALELVHGGWENGEGASGCIVFDCESATVRIEHASYFTDSDNTETAL